VQLPAVLLARAGQGEAGSQADFLADLLAEVAELREQVARTEAERDAAESVAEAQVEAARDASRARAEAAKVEVAAVRELADRLTAELAELRRPWWRRLIG
jgi:predicted  nucleic acid-binding Zn-ribbon protein